MEDFSLGSVFICRTSSGPERKFIVLIGFDTFFCQRAKVSTTTPMTTELFMQWKQKKVEEREAGLAAQRAERAKHDRMRSGLLEFVFGYSYACWIIRKLS